MGIGFNSQLPSTITSDIRYILANSTGIVQQGRNKFINNNQDLPVQPFNTLYFPSTAAVISFTSTSPDDTATGIGARALLVTGLDGNWDPIFEIVVTNGTSPALTVQQFIRIESVLVIETGSSEINVGFITGTHNGNTITALYENTGNAERLAFHVPRGRVGYITSARIAIFGISGQGEKQGMFTLWARFVNGTKLLLLPEGLVNYGGVSFFQPSIWYPIPEMTDIWIQCIAYQNNTSASGVLYYYTEPAPA